MTVPNNLSDNSTLIALAVTLAIGYLSTRFKFLRWLWRYVPLLVVVSAWLLNRKNAVEKGDTGDQPEPKTNKK